MRNDTIHHTQVWPEDFININDSIIDAIVKDHFALHPNNAKQILQASTHLRQAVGLKLSEIDE
jgi:hypothetical protein